nr:MAG TPA: hypothetical protein [Inoviridae sp.]
MRFSTFLNILIHIHNPFAIHLHINPSVYNFIFYL